MDYRVSTVRRLSKLLLWGLFVVLAPPATLAADKGSEFYEEAVSLHRKGEFEGAVIQLKNALQADPRLLPAMVLLGETYNALGNGAAAESSLKEAVKLGADPATTAVPIARAQLSQFKHAELLKAKPPADLPAGKRAEFLAIQARAALQASSKERFTQILNELEVLDPYGEATLSLKATMAMRDGRLDEAANLLETAAKAAPDSTTVLMTRASLHHVRDEIDAALADYSAIVKLEPDNMEARLARLGLLLDVGRGTQAEEDLTYFGKKAPRDPRVHYLRSLKLSQAGDSHGARAALAEAANAIEALGRPMVLRNQQLLLVAGIVNFNLDNPEAARSYLEPYLERTPGDLATRRMLALTYLKQKEFQRAYKLVEQMIQQAGPSPDLLALLARGYAGAGKHELATAALERATAESPDDVGLQTQLAMSWAARGQGDTAIASLSALYEQDEKSGAGGLPLAILHLNRGELAEAEAVATRLVSARPDDLTSLNLLGVAQSGLGKLADARRSFDKALAQDASFLPARLNLAKLDRREGQFDVAERRITELMVEKPKDTRLMLELARTLRDKGDAKGARRWAEDALAAAPDSFETALFLIELHLAQKDYERAWNTAFDQTKRHPKNLYVMEAEARVLAAQGKVDDVRVRLKRMVDTAEFNADWLLRIAAVQVNAGEFSDAQYALFKAVQARPDSVLARTRLAEVELRLGNLESAEELVAGLAEDEPTSPNTLRLRGDLAAARGEHVDSAAHYQAALTGLGRPDPSLTLKLHLAQRHAGQAAEAEKLLQDVLAADAAALWARGALGEHLMLQARNEEARTHFETFLAAQPDHVNTLNNLANVLIRLGELPAAEQPARRALALQPDNPLINDTLGWILVQSDRAEEGLRYLRDARTRAAGLPEIGYHLAVALDRLGRTAEARAELRDALSTNVKFDELAEAEQLQARLSAQ